MKEVNFEEMSIKNFLSIGNVPLVFNFPKGLNIISGFNYDKQDENGVGKTSLVESFYWLIFGDTLRDLKKDEVVNDINGKNCEGYLKFNITKNGETKSYRIERGMKPSFCRLYVNDTEDKTLSSIQLVNEKIQTIISSTPAIFRNCVVLCVNESVPFMSQSKTERKEFVESMFRLEAIKHMDKLVKNIYNEIVRTQELELEKNQGLIKNKDLYNTRITDFETQRTTKIKSLSTRKESYSVDIDKLKESILNIDTSELENINSLISSKQNEIIESNKNLSDIQAILKNNNTLLNKQSNELNQYNSTLEDYKLKLKGFTNKVEFPESKNKKDYLTELKATTISDIENLNKNITINEVEVTTNTKKLNQIKILGAVCGECNRPYDKSDIEKTNLLIENIKKDIATAQSKISDYKKALQEKNNNIKQFDLMLSYIELNAKKNNIQQSINELKTDVESKNLEVEPIQDNILSINKTIKELEHKKQKIQSSIQHNTNTKNQIESIQKFLIDVDKDINNIINENNPFTDLLNTTNLSLNSSNDKISDNKTKLNIYDTIKFVTSDQGIKSYIIKKLLKVLNERIKYYLTLFESNAKLEFDEFFEDKLFNEKGMEKSYDNFSGGERKRIDLACLFSFLDIRRIQGDVRFNVIFFDELLDSAISSKACSLIFTTLKERLDLYNENSYIITHRTEIKNDAKPLINNYILLEKRNGFTKLGEIKNGN